MVIAVMQFVCFLSFSFAQMEDVIARMQDEKNGILIRTVKSFLSKIPSVFSGKVQNVPYVLLEMHWL